MLRKYTRIAPQKKHRRSSCVYDVEALVRRTSTSCATSARFSTTATKMQNSILSFAPSQARSSEASVCRSTNSSASARRRLAALLPQHPEIVDASMRRCPIAVHTVHGLVLLEPRNESMVDRSRVARVDGDCSRRRRLGAIHHLGESYFSVSTTVLIIVLFVENWRLHKLLREHGISTRWHKRAKDRP